MKWQERPYSGKVNHLVWYECGSILLGEMESREESTAYGEIPEKSLMKEKSDMIILRNHMMVIDKNWIYYISVNDDVGGWCQWIAFNRWTHYWCYFWSVIIRNASTISLYDKYLSLKRWIIWNYTHGYTTLTYELLPVRIDFVTIIPTCLDFKHINQTKANKSSEC